MKRRKPSADLRQDGLRHSSKEEETSTFAQQFKPHKPSAKAEVGEGKKSTLSIAIPGSILVNAQTDELRALLVSQIARTCAIFCVNEIIVFHEELSESLLQTLSRGKSSSRGTEMNIAMSDAFMARLLEYLETPQYLRKALFPVHSSLRHAGLLPPTDMPHHLRRDDASPYREGVIIENYFNDSTIYVDVGLNEPVQIPTSQSIPPNTRVTVQMPSKSSHAKLVPPTLPRESHGLYWGYNVRYASSISEIFTASPFRTESKAGYDLTIGTSERGTSIEQIHSSLPNFSHVLLVLGGLAGLELSVAADETLELGATDAEDLFDYWINICASQGSRTIRTEEALLIALSRLKTVLDQNALG